MTTDTAVVTTAPAPLAIHAGIDVGILAGQLAPSTLAMYRRDFAAYLTWAGSPADALQPATFARFRAHLANETAYSPNTINRMLSAVKRVVREAAAQGYLPEVTADEFDRVTGVKPSALRERTRPNNRTAITPAQMRCMLDAPDQTKLVGLRDAALLATLASSGLRVAEVVGLTVGHIVVTKNGRGKPAYLLTGVMGKGQAEGREAHLSAEAYDRIMQWIDARPVMSQHIFTQVNTGTHGNVVEPTAEPITAVAAWKAVRKYARRCGVAHVKPHDFRRFVGTNLAKSDIRKAQRALGHKSIETTARHYVLDELEPGLTDDLC